MKKLLYFVPMLIGLLNITKADAQTVENDEIRDWSGELGYFQKAHRDLSGLTCNLA